MPAPHDPSDLPTTGSAPSAAVAGAPEPPEPTELVEPTTPPEPTEPTSQEGTGERWRFVGSLPFLIIVALVVAILIKTFLVQAFYIPSPSMEPTLHEGDRVLVSKLTYRFGEVHRQDVIVFTNPNLVAPRSDRGAIGGFFHWLGEGIGLAQPENEDFIKRVIGLPGETVQISNDTVHIDGGPLDEPYLTAHARTCNGDFGPVTVPAGALFVLGDNRCNSADSRFGLGFVPIHDVVGHAFVIIWPFSDAGGL